jgi:hypothetical protein
MDNHLAYEERHKEKRTKKREREQYADKAEKHVGNQLISAH